MGIQGDGLHSQNTRLRFLVLIFVGIMVVAGILFFQGKDLEKTDDNSKTTPKEQTEALKAELQSENYQIEVQDASPSVQ